MRTRLPSARRARSPRLTAVFGALIATWALIGSLGIVSPASAATVETASSVAAASIPGSRTVETGIVKAAAVVGFNAENIINDALFYDGLSMTSAEIQAFLDTKIGACQNGRCLNVLNITADSKAAYYSQTTGNLVCGALTGGTMRASEYIYRVQVACGISAKVILVTMQKEQGLVTDKAPTETELRRAMGHLCSDTAPCESAAAGVGNQIFGGTEQLKKYKATAFGKQPGRNWVGYNPATSCGGTYLNIQNYATAALYNYTPYQPNAAALAAGYGLGDGCSSYGNRNFYNYYTQWFGSTQAAVDPCKAPASSATVAAAGEYVTTTGLNGRAAPTTDCANILRTFSQGAIVTRVAIFGSWWLVRADGTEYWVHSDYLKPADPVSYSMSRVSGVDRYATSVAVSRSAYPAGVGTVLIASGMDFPDALSAGAAAGSAGASLLLTDPESLPGSVREELTRLNPTRVVLVGAEVRVSVAVRDAVAAVVPQAKIDRVAGIDRYETSRLIAKEFSPNATTAYIATGVNYADAVVAAGLGGVKKVPVILVDGSAPTVDPKTIAQLSTSGMKNLIIAGAEPAVNASVEASLKSAGFTVKRIGGVDRFQTSRLLNADAFPGGATGALFAAGYSFPDALTGSVLAAKTNSPLFTTPGTCMVSTVKDWLIASKTTTVTLIGGEPVLSAAVAGSVRC